jgi:hypothetical protein
MSAPFSAGLKGKFNSRLFWKLLLTNSVKLGRNLTQFSFHLSPPNKKYGHCLTSINPHLLDLSCLHYAYTNKMAYKPEPISHFLYGAPEAIRTPDLRIRNN